MSYELRNRITTAPAAGSSAWWTPAAAAVLRDAFFVERQVSGIRAYALTAGAVGNTSQQVFTSASITPTANRLVLLAVEVAWAVDGAVPAALNISGNSLTWVEVARVGIDDNANGTPGDGLYGAQLILYRALGSSPTAGAVTINTVNDAVSASWSVAEFDGVDTSGTNGSAAIVQSATNRADLATTLSVALADFASPTNYVYAAFGASDFNGVPRTFWPGSGFYDIHDTGAQYSSVTSIAENYAHNTVEVIASASTNIGGIAIELKEFSAAGNTGTLASTLDNATMSMAGAETMSGTLASTLAGGAMSLTGAETMTGTLSATLASATMTATAAEIMAGTFTSTLANAVLLMTTSNDATGTLSSTLDNATMSFSGAETMSGPFGSTLSAATMSFTGAETMAGTLSATLAGVTMTATGAERMSGTLASTLAGVTMTASGTETMAGALSSTLAGATMTVSAAEKMAGSLVSTLSGVTMTATGSTYMNPTGTFVSALDNATMNMTGSSDSGETPAGDTQEWRRRGRR